MALTLDLAATHLRGRGVDQLRAARHDNGHLQVRDIVVKGAGVDLQVMIEPFAFHAGFHRHKCFGIDRRIVGGAAAGGAERIVLAALLAAVI